MRDSTSTFQSRLAASVAAAGSPLCVGLDPGLSSLPPHLRSGAEGIRQFCLSLIEATTDLAAAYKPNSAFFERLGGAGFDLLAEVVAAGQAAGAVVIIDAKRGDIGNTAEAYAETVYDRLGGDACTVNGYLGHDSVAPFLERADRLAFVLARTSNPGSREIQELEVGEERVPLYLRVAELAQGWSEQPPGGTVGLVAGATWPEDIVRIRERAPGLPILVPGVGAQGGDLAAAATAASGPQGTAPFLLSVSRGIAGAAPDEDFAAAAREAARGYRAQLQEALHSSATSPSQA